MNTMVDCKEYRSNLADLLLDPGFAEAHPEMEAHAVGCNECGQELREMRETMAMMDAWTAPEPTPYFDTRLKARLREAAAEAPEGLWARTKSWLMFSTNRSFRPAVAAALAVVMVAGGGGVLMMEMHSPHVAQVHAQSAAVNDLKIMDNNAQALQQMDQLLDSSDDGSSDSPTT
ncbi:MAG: hypothetical protein PW792_01385 [Acidobacteriaceae bacterium]|nr:hypothetical protein [Acidobacteriaceae bacterium]